MLSDPMMVMRKTHRLSPFHNPHVVLPQFIHLLPKQPLPKFLPMIPLLPQRLIYAPHRALTEFILEVFQKVRRLFVPSVPPLRNGLATPMRCPKPGAQPHPVGDSLDESTRAMPPSVVLEAVDEFVDYDTLYFVVARCIGGLVGVGGFFDGVYVA